jgi:hypothetical protein
VKRLFFMGVVMGCSTPTSGSLPASSASAPASAPHLRAQPPTLVLDVGEASQPSIVTYIGDERYVGLPWFGFTKVTVDDPQVASLDSGEPHGQAPGNTTAHIEVIAWASVRGDCGVSRRAGQRDDHSHLCASEEPEDLARLRVEEVPALRCRRDLHDGAVVEVSAGCLLRTKKSAADAWSAGYRWGDYPWVGRVLGELPVEPSAALACDFLGLHAEGALVDP